MELVPSIPPPPGVCVQVPYRKPSPCTAQVELVMNFTPKRLSKGGTVRTKKKTLGEQISCEKLLPPCCECQVRWEAASLYLLQRQVFTLGGKSFDEGTNGKRKEDIVDKLTTHHDETQ